MPTDKQWSAFNERLVEFASGSHRWRMVSRHRSAVTAKDKFMQSHS